MKKKILIGSILAICILVGVSFTSVVGYNNIESNIGVSPLFNIRSRRAIDGEDSGALSCEYVGKGNTINLLIPNRDNEKEKIRQIIDRIQAMSDDTFNKFVNLIVNRIQKYDDFNDIKNDDVILALNKLRNHQELLILNNSNINENYTFRFEFIPTICWFPGCIPLVIFGAIIQIIGVIIAIPFVILFFMFFWNPDTMTAC